MTSMSCSLEKTLPNKLYIYKLSGLAYKNSLLFHERKSAIVMSSRWKWQETDMKSALDKVKRGSVSIRDAGDQYKTPEISIHSIKSLEEFAKPYPAGRNFFLALCSLKG